jgi:hypothetical protein
VKKGGDVANGHGLSLAVPHGNLGAHHASRSVEDDLRQRLLGRDDASLHQNSAEGDGSMATHRGIAAWFKVQNSEICFLHRRRSDQRGIHIAVTAWLMYQEGAQVVQVIAHVL